MWCSTILVLVTSSIATSWAISIPQRFNKSNFVKFKVPSSGGGGIGVFGVEEEMTTTYTMFAEAGSRTRDDAQELCRMIDNEADLSIINKVLLGLFLRRNFPPVGTYWINGKEPAASTFEAESDCENMKKDFKPTEITIRQRTSKFCLALVKGNSVANTYVQEVPCSNRYNVLCSFITEPNKCT